MSRPPRQDLWLAQRELPDLGTRCVCCDDDAGDRLAPGVWHRNARFPACAACAEHAVDDSQGARAMLAIPLGLGVFLLSIALSGRGAIDVPTAVLAAVGALLALTSGRAIVRRLATLRRLGRLPANHHPELTYFVEKVRPLSRIQTANPALAARLRQADIVIDTPRRSRS